MTHAARLILAAPFFPALADRGLVVCSFSCCFTSYLARIRPGVFSQFNIPAISCSRNTHYYLLGVAMLKPIVYSFFTVILMAGLMLWGLHKCWRWFVGRCKALDTAVDRLLDFSMGGE